jgi:hypothetical protein
MNTLRRHRVGCVFFVRVLGQTTLEVSWIFGRSA